MIDDISPRDNSKIIALLCIGDVSPADGEVALPLTPLFGQPMLHHTVKALQRLGITQFCIGVDSVPGALLSYRDMVTQQGIELRFVREPSAMATLMSTDMRALVLRADTIWDAGLIDRALQQNGPLIATVEERSENQMFERIDLNSRWAGMAILDRSTLDALTLLPDGWDMASALLRQGLQDTVSLWPLKQSEIQDGRVRRLENAGDLAAAQRLLMTPPLNGPVTLESKLFSKALARFGPAIWSVPWGRGLAEFSFPGLSAITALLALAGFPLGASVAAIVSVLAFLIRNIVKSAEYRAAQADWMGGASWLLLVAALIAVLNLTQQSIFEAGFLGLTLSGLSLVSAFQPNDAKYRLLSPLVLALSMMLGALAGGEAFAVKLLIVAEIIGQLIRVSGAVRNRTSTY